MYLLLIKSIILYLIKFIHSEFEKKKVLNQISNLIAMN